MARQTGDDAADEHGRLLPDNVFGAQAEDAVRRDFTINALYFDPATESVWDYVGGVHDIKRRKLRLIGDPVTRYREDPVRMLRAVRLAAKLGIAIETKTAAPIPKLAPLIHNVPPARLFDEMQKLLLSGHAVESLKSLRRHGLHHGVLPLLDVILEQPLGSRFIELALANTDERVRTGKPVTPAFLFATLLWHEVLAELERGQGQGRATDPGAVRGDGPGAGAAGGTARDSAPLRGDDQGDLGAAAALRTARRPAPVPPARASALSRRLRFSAGCAATAAKSRSSSPTGGTASSTPTAPSASACCARTKRRAKAPALARPQAQGERPRHGDPPRPVGALRRATRR